MFDTGHFQAAKVGSIQRAYQQVEVTLSKPGASFSPLNERMRVLSHFQGSGKHLAFGEGILARLIAWFTASRLFYQLDSVETKYLGDDFLNSSMAPVGGWIGVDPKIRNKQTLFNYLADYGSNLPIPTMAGYDSKYDRWFADGLNFDNVFVCSAPDLLWLRCKMFVMIVEARFTAATKQQKAKYDALLQGLRGDQVSEIES